MGREGVELAVTVFILSGLSVFVVGITSYLLERLQDFGIPWQIQIAVAGLMVMIVGGVAMKLASRYWGG